MRRILIVDDEPFIVNGLAGMIKETDNLELEVYKASSATEAMHWFQRTAMDIVLTDICMPGMDGLELQQHIVRQWPRCKVIFLTGHNDFNYVKEAIHHRAIDYILKTEGDQAILAAVRRALEELDREIEMGAQLEKAQTQIQSARPLLQKEFLYDLLQGEVQPKQRLQEQLNDLELPFNAGLPVLLLVGKVDEWTEQTSADRTLLLYAIQNIAEEYLSSSVKSRSFTYDKSKIAWMIQPLDDAVDAEDKEYSRRVTLFARGTVERIQQSCKELLRLKLSFAVASEFCSWYYVSEQFERLNRTLRRNFGMGHELLLTDRTVEPTFANASKDSMTRMIQRQTAQLEIFLESGQQSEYKNKLSELLNHESIAADPELRLVASYQLVTMIMTYSLNEGILKVLSENTDLDLDKPLKLAAQSSWEETILRLADIGEAIFAQREGLNDQHGRNLVNRIKQYIEEHLAGDLSLTQIGEVVSLNPAYLSRLYKQLTGNMLSDTIMEARLSEAKRLLKETNDKVQDIATQVGFESAAYFTRFFKKATECTPQEYREFTRK